LPNHKFGDCSKPWHQSYVSTKLYIEYEQLRCDPDSSGQS
jgi:hypothetical protein